MEEYSEIDDAFLESLPTPEIPPRHPSFLESIADWAFYGLVFNTEFFSESFIRELSYFGERFLNKQIAKARILSQALNDAFLIGNGEPPKYSTVPPEKRMRGAAGLFNPIKYHNAVGDMNMHCQIQSNLTEVHAMELGLPIDTALGVSASFQILAFYWALLKSPFTALRS